MPSEDVLNPQSQQGCARGWQVTKVFTGEPFNMKVQKRSRTLKVRDVEFQYTMFSIEPIALRCPVSGPIRCPNSHVGTKAVKSKDPKTSPPLLRSPTGLNLVPSELTRTVFDGPEHKAHVDREEKRAATAILNAATTLQQNMAASSSKISDIFDPLSALTAYCEGGSL